MYKAITCSAVILFSLCNNVFSQDVEYKKDPTIAVHIALNDFKTAADLRKNGIADVLDKQQWTNTKRMFAGIEFSYIKGISKLLDFSTTLTGSFVDYPIPGKLSDGQSRLLLEAVATGHLKLLPDNFYVVPYLTAGIGASKYKGYYGAIMPLGLGLQGRLMDRTFLFVNTQYRIPITNTTTAYHLYHSFGLGYSMPRKVMVPAAEVSIPASN